MAPATQREIDRMNENCTCITLDQDSLTQALDHAVGDPAFCGELIATHPHLLAAQPLFISAAHAERMQKIIAAIERVAVNPAYQEVVLSTSPEIARFDPGAQGVFMGYDFHLGSDGPKLIEINTNAGGALLNAYLLQAQRACCSDRRVADATPFDLNSLLDDFMLSFDCEWRRQGRSGSVRSVAIVDHSPQQQYLYPEFVLFQRLFASRGIEAVVAAPKDLVRRGQRLWCGDLALDLVYNRLTDFYFEESSSAVLRDAYLAREVVVTPSPRHHALLANKRNLSLLTDVDQLRRWNVPASDVATLLDGIPRTFLLAPDNADSSWAKRNHLFFKPTSGYGGKAAYRGDKLTKKVWAEILKSQYVAQDIVVPSGRAVSSEGVVKNMKVDLRNYTYDGRVQLVTARLYQGQTTNFRTEGGGFAPVFVGRADNTLACGPSQLP